MRARVSAVCCGKHWHNKKYNRVSHDKGDDFHRLFGVCVSPATECRLLVGVFWWCCSVVANVAISCLVITEHITQKSCVCVRAGQKVGLHSVGR